MEKIESVILMAAGLGSRMYPITETTPKPLVKVHGKPIIERLIEAFEEKEIENIYVVVGYLKEQFEYLVDKYPNVQLIVNEEYLTKNNISSIHVVESVLLKGACIISEADLLLNDKTIIGNTVETSKYLARYVEGESNDWSFRMEDHRITKICVGGQNVYNMVGLSYWTAADSQKIAQQTLNKYKEEGHETLYWDEVVDELLDQIVVGIQEVTQEQIIEIDTFDELKQIDESYC